LAGWRRPRESYALSPFSPAYLFVNGALAIDGGKYTGKLAGRVLRHRSAVTPAAGGAGQ
jgi:hypothetical protein